MFRGVVFPLHAVQASWCSCTAVATPDRFAFAVGVIPAGRDDDLASLFATTRERLPEASVPLFRHRTHVGTRVGVLPTPISVSMVRCVSDGVLPLQVGDTSSSGGSGGASPDGGVPAAVSALTSIRTAVVCGEDGVGKSALARQYCRVGRERRE